MKKIILLTSLLFTGLIMQAQSGSWKIKLNSKTILFASKEDEIKNSKNIKWADWKKSGWLEIIFAEDQKNTWVRSFQLVDEQGNELLRKDSTVHAKISLPELRKLFAEKKQIKIYTTISPVDPRIAIRMRKVHLCTLRLP